jgi:DNA helicase HerA-like ATPase
MTDGLSEPQSDYLQHLLNAEQTTAGEAVQDYLSRLISRATREIGIPPQGFRAPTIGAVRRAMNIVLDRLKRMRKSSEMMRRSPKLGGLNFEPLPNPFGRPDEIIRPGQVSILYLGGYDHITQCSIAAITLETLFDFRANLTNRIPPFLTVLEEAHTFIPSAREGTEDAVSLSVIRRIITEGRKFGSGLLLISQRPSRLDETIISQCNSFLILRLVNPRDQTFVRSIMENLTEADARLIPGFGPGQGIISGQVVRFPLPVRVDMDEDLLNAEIGDENFFDQVSDWKPDKSAGARTANQDAIDKVDAIAGRRGPACAMPRRGRSRKKR